MLFARSLVRDKFGSADWDVGRTITPIALKGDIQKDLWRESIRCRIFEAPFKRRKSEFTEIKTKLRPLVRREDRVYREMHWLQIYCP